MSPRYIDKVNGKLFIDALLSQGDDIVASAALAFLDGAIAAHTHEAAWIVINEDFSDMAMPEGRNKDARQRVTSLDVRVANAFESLVRNSGSGGDVDEVAVIRGKRGHVDTPLDYVKVVCRCHMALPDERLARGCPEDRRKLEPVQASAARARYPAPEEVLVIDEESRLGGAHKVPRCWQTKKEAEV